MTEKTYTGKAKCSPEDKFDIELGKKISLTRAWLKYNVSRAKCLQEEAKFISKELINNKREMQKQLDLIEKNEDKLRRIAW